MRTWPVFDALGRTPSPDSAERCGAAAGVLFSFLEILAEASPGCGRERFPVTLPCPRPGEGPSFFLRPKAPSCSPAGGVEISATDVQTQFLVRTAPSHKNCVWTIRSGDSRPGLAGSSRGNPAGAWKRRDTRAPSRLPAAARSPLPVPRPYRAASPAPTSFQRSRGASHPGFDLMPQRGV